MNSRRERGAEKIANSIDATRIIDEITNEMKDDTLAKLMARRDDYLHSKGHDRSKSYKHILATFEPRWTNLETRMALVPGKDVLKLFRQRVQDDYDVTLTDARIAESINRDEIPADMRALLDSLEAFRTSRHGD